MYLLSFYCFSLKILTFHVFEIPNVKLIFVTRLQVFNYGAVETIDRLCDTKPSVIFVN